MSIHLESALPGAVGRKLQQNFRRFMWPMRPRKRNGNEPYALTLASAELMLAVLGEGSQLPPPDDEIIACPQLDIVFGQVLGDFRSHRAQSTLERRLGRALDHIARQHLTRWPA